MRWMYRLMLVALFATAACEKKVDAGKVPTQEQLAALRAFCEDGIRIECGANAKCCKTPRHTYENAEACFAKENECAEIDELMNGRYSVNVEAMADARKEWEAAAADCREPDYTKLGEVLVPNLDEGADCGGTHREGALNGCKEGQYCRIISVDLKDGHSNIRYEATCTRQAKLGEACQLNLKTYGYEDECEGEAWCEPSGPDASTGTCRPLPGFGEACTPSNRCRTELTCNENTCEQEPLDPASAPFCFYRSGDFCEKSTQFSGTQTCNVYFKCPESSSYGARCERQSDGTFTCTCEVNQVLGNQFKSSGLCNLGDEEQAQALRQGCGFDFDTGL